jgi:hypothetical protein
MHFTQKKNLKQCKQNREFFYYDKNLDAGKRVKTEISFFGGKNGELLKGGKRCMNECAFIEMGTST